MFGDGPIQGIGHRPHSNPKPVFRLTAHWPPAPRSATTAPQRLPPPALRKNAIFRDGMADGSSRPSSLCMMTSETF